MMQFFEYICTAKELNEFVYKYSLNRSMVESNFWWEVGEKGAIYFLAKSWYELTYFNEPYMTLQTLGDLDNPIWPWTRLSGNLGQDMTIGPSVMVKRCWDKMGITPHCPPQPTSPKNPQNN